MKTTLKAMVAVATLGVACLLGVYLLDGFVLWKMVLFFAACWGIGHIVYAVLRAIDQQYKQG